MWDGSWSTGFMVLLCSRLVSSSRLSVHNHRSIGRLNGCSTNFVYLVQAPEFRVDDRLFVDQCRDVIWLTYAVESKNKDVLFLPNSTWTEGRNALLQKAMNTSFYEYFVFLDDDALRMIKSHDDRNPWHVFETNLRKWRPAVGYISRYLWQFVDKSSNITTGQTNVDAIVNAFHYTTFGTLLPYDGIFDNQSWYYSQMINGLMVATFYPNHRVGFNDLTLDNAFNEHRYGSDKKKLDWTVVKQYLHNLVVNGSQPYKALSRAMCSSTADTELCNWQPSRCRGERSYALDCIWLNGVLNRHHRLASIIKASCATPGYIPLSVC